MPIDYHAPAHASLRAYASQVERAASLAATGHDTGSVAIARAGMESARHKAQSASILPQYDCDTCRISLKRIARANAEATDTYRATLLAVD